MADRNFSPVQALDKQIKILAGFASIHTDASILSQTLLGGTFTKTGTGEYTLTLADKYPELLCAQVSVEAATAVDLVAQIDNHAVSTNKTVVINLNAGATPTDPSAACKLHVLLVLKNSTIAP
jgi:hypothetical protein